MSTTRYKEVFINGKHIIVDADAIRCERERWGITGSEELSQKEIGELAAEFKLNEQEIAKLYALIRSCVDSIMAMSLAAQEVA